MVEATSGVEGTTAYFADMLDVGAKRDLLVCLWFHLVKILS